MKFLFDIFPILLFFVAFKFFGIYAATGVAMGTTVLQVVYLFALGKKIEYMLWVNLVVIGIFGGLTIFLHNELFIKWKPTVLYGLFAGTLFISHAYFGKNLLKTILRTSIELPDVAWKKMNYSWVLFFAFLAVLNLAVAYNVSTEIWVNFKLFGLVGFTITFVVGQSVWLSRYVVKEESSQPLS